jgi:hypothetical protein
MNSEWMEEEGGRSIDGYRRRRGDEYEGDRRLTDPATTNGPLPPRAT